ncbi:MAG: prolyl oligopeptidase family serine peptidase [Xenococcaceae cyanobacterium MO_207.B15]|nr:prolyl oligopeptidase family serine peptidase [Xenococcaceae cyanobacterium MO_207.B15]
MDRLEFFESNGVRIYGTLTLPNRTEKSPACLFIGGSFPQTRDGNLDNSQTDWFPTPLPERNLFRDEAKILEREGIATFRYDKRGCGESEGDFNSTSLFDLVSDAFWAWQWLRGVPEIDTERIGVLGQSEGAVIALMLAAQEPDICFYIWQGGIYNNLEQIIKWQAEGFWKLDRTKIDNFKQNVPLMYWLYKQIDDLVASAKGGENFFRLGDEDWSKNLYLQNLKEHFDNPPSAFVDKVKCPVLILHGERDHNTPSKEALLMLEALLKAGNKNVTTHIFPGLDHSFRRLGERNEDFVMAMKRPLAPVMPKALTNWLISLVNS